MNKLIVLPLLLVLFGCTGQSGSVISVEEIVELAKTSKYEKGQKFQISGEIESVAPSKREAGLRGKQKSHAAVVIQPQGEFKVGEKVSLECEYERFAHIPNVSEEIPDLYVVTGSNCNHI